MSKNEKENNGVSRVKAAAKNPAVSQLFDKFITGGFDPNVVPESYTNFDVELSDNETENVCKLLTRSRINAYKNDINRSGKELIAQYLKAVNDDEKDPVVFANKVIMTELLGHFDPEIYEDDDALKITVAALFRTVFKDVVGIPVEVKEAANDSATVTETTEVVKEDIPKVEVVTDNEEPAIVKEETIDKEGLDKIQVDFKSLVDGKITKEDFIKTVETSVKDERVVNAVKENLNNTKTPDSEETTALTTTVNMKRIPESTSPKKMGAVDMDWDLKVFAKLAEKRDALLKEQGIDSTIGNVVGQTMKMIRQTV